MSNTPDNPVNSATRQLAEDIHNDLLRDLGRSPDEALHMLDGNLDNYRGQYNARLFGDLAIHIAGVQMPPDPTPADRARGVTEALQRISSTPTLWESITQAPYSPGNKPVAIIAGQLPARIDEETVEHATNLQRLISKRGYLDREIIPEGQTVQLQYRTDADIKTRMLGRDKLPGGSLLTLKLVASTASWDIKRYKHWSDYDGYYDYIDTRKALLKDVFTLLVIDTATEAPKQLQERVGKKLRFGKVSTASPLKFDYGFTREVQEMPGYEESMDYNTLTLPARLQQAYLGNTYDFPLF